jgi:hypothetical protein
MNKEILEMSEKERDRLVLLRQVEKGMLSQVKAAELLKITDRHIRNLLTKIKIEGDKGGVSKKRGKARRAVVHQDFQGNRSFMDDWSRFMACKVKKQKGLQIQTPASLLWRAHSRRWISS